MTHRKGYTPEDPSPICLNCGDPWPCFQERIAESWDEGWAACSAWWHGVRDGRSEPERAINPYRKEPT